MTDEEIITITKKRLKLYTDDSDVNDELQSMLNGHRASLELSGVKVSDIQNSNKYSALLVESFIIYADSNLFKDTQKNNELGNVYTSFVIQMRNAIISEEP